MERPLAQRTFCDIACVGLEQMADKGSGKGCGSCSGAQDGGLDRDGGFPLFQNMIVRIMPAVQVVIRTT